MSASGIQLERGICNAYRMNEVLLMTCSICKTERRYAVPLAQEADARWRCPCGLGADPRARFHSATIEGVVPEKFQALDAIFRKVAASLRIEPADHDRQCA